MKLGVLGPEGGMWPGWTADVQGGGPPGGYHDPKPEDQWMGVPGSGHGWSPSYTNAPAFTDPGRHAGYESNILPGGVPSGRSLDPRGVFHRTREPAWPSGGMVSRPIGDRNYDVQMFTGASYSTVRPAGGWDRGQVYRWATPTVRPGKPPIMYDPTDPDTWDEVRSFN